MKNLTWDFQSVKGLLLSSRSFPQQPPVSAPPALPSWQLQQNDNKVKKKTTVLYWQHTYTCRRPIYWQQQQVLRRAKHPLKWRQAHQRLEALVQVPPMPALPARLRWSALIRGRNWVERRASRIFDEISSETDSDMKPLFICLRSFLYSTVCIKM